MSGIDPITVYHFDPEEFETHAELVYPNSVLDEMARRAAERIDDEVTQQVLARLGYVKPVRCRECKRYEWREHLGRSYCHGEYPTEPDGYCAWGKRREDEWPR